MTDRLTKFNEETGKYEYKERAKTQEEFNAQRKAVIQRLGEFEDWWLAQHPFVDCTKCPERKKGCHKNCKFIKAYKKEKNDEQR